MSHAAADALLRTWAAVELGEIRKLWYSPASAGYRDWEPPKDPDSVRMLRTLRTRDEAEIHRTGWCLYVIRKCHREAIRRHYLERRDIGRGARGAALEAFSRAWGIWSEVLDGED